MFLIFETLDSGENASTVSGTRWLHVMGPNEYRPLQIYWRVETATVSELLCSSSCVSKTLRDRNKP
jgi:hypothetical protein